MRPKKEKLTAENLQNTLWETLQRVRSKKMKPAEANAITGSARAICAVTKLQLEYSKLTGTKPRSVNQLISN